MRSSWAVALQDLLCGFLYWATVYSGIVFRMRKSSTLLLHHFLLISVRLVQLQFLPCSFSFCLISMLGKLLFRYVDVAFQQRFYEWFFLKKKLITVSSGMFDMLVSERVWQFSSAEFPFVPPLFAFYYSCTTFGALCIRLIISVRQNFQPAVLPRYVFHVMHGKVCGNKCSKLAALLGSGKKSSSFC